MTLGNKIKDARKEARLSQEELANKLSVSRSAIAKWESDKGMPDITNLKLLSQVMNVSIDYLLDDGTKLDLMNTREPIDLNSYTDKKINIFNKKAIKDKIVYEKYPDSDIYTLLADEKLTKGEKFVDLLILFLTPLVDAVRFSKQLNNIDKEFYLVNKQNKQYVVIVTDEFVESHELAHKVEYKAGTKFELGQFKLVCSQKIKGTS